MQAARLVNNNPEPLDAQSMHRIVAAVEAFSSRLTQKMAGLKMGAGCLKTTQLGAMVNKASRDKVAELVDDAVARGARVLTGGSIPLTPGYFYPATVLVNVSLDSRLLHEAISRVHGEQVHLDFLVALSPCHAPTARTGPASPSAHP
jgi:hypothetical protein